MRINTGCSTASSPRYVLSPLIIHLTLTTIQEVPDARSAVKNNQKNDASLPQNTGAWSKNVGIHRVRWNNGNGPAASGLLASATASGLCRVDVLWGRWIKDKLPYGGIEQIRMENGDAMDVDSDLSDMESLEDAA